MKNDLKNMDEILSRHLPLPSQEATEEDCNRVLQHLRTQADYTQRESYAGIPAVSVFRWRRFAFAAAGVVLAVLIGSTIMRRPVAFAVVESVDGSLYRVVEGESHAISIGGELANGETVRTNGGAGGMLALADGSRVEMRSRSQLTLERATDGVRIRLGHGGIVVSAAKQRAGHLYVQTKDVTVSVVGTVFLVNAEELGSKVAVIEGEVRVHQGATEKKLLPGQQVSTNSKMPTLEVKEEIAWSRNAEAHVALLQQTAATALAFEVITIRPHTAAAADGRGGAGGSNLAPNGCAAVIPTVDPGRLLIPDTTVWTLIALAYPYPNSDLFGACGHLAPLNLISGGPGWIKSDKWDLEANIPESARLAVNYRLDFGTSIPALSPGEAAKLQKMMLAFLEERFKFAVRREVKEVSAYALTLEKGTSPKLTVFPWPSSSFGASLDDPKFKTVWARIPSGRSLGEGATMSGKDVYMADLARLLARRTGRPVVDRTGFTDPFSFILVFNPPNTNNAAWADLPNVFTAVEKQVGLKLEETKTTVETWVIERIDKPSEN
jgi:uncharacterized protein (TIGR03435 family)